MPATLAVTPVVLTEMLVALPVVLTEMLVARPVVSLEMHFEILVDKHLVALEALERRLCVSLSLELASGHL
jgi:hypothetical protein